MSIKVLKVREPRMDIEADRTYVAMMGGSHVTTKAYGSSTANNSQVTWSVTTPSVRVGMDRRIDVEFRFSVTCKTALGVPCKLNANFEKILNAGPRQYPMHSIIEVMNCRLNDQAFSYEPAKLIHAMMRYGNTVEDRQNFTGSTPHKPDISPNYELVSANVGNRNPFISYYNSGEEDSRAMNFWATKDAKNETINFIIYETLMVSPFYWGKNDYQCLFGIQNFDVSFTLTNVKRLLSGSNTGWVGPVDGGGAFIDGVIDSLDVQIQGEQAQKLHLTFITPQPDQEIPRLLHYPFYQVKRFSQNLDRIISGGNLNSAEFNNITLHEIPKRMYIFAKQIPNNVVNEADFFMAIDKVVINFDNQDGRLSTMDGFDLWKLSAKNGLKMSYLNYSKVMGSVLCIEFGTDLNLNPLLCAGVRGNFQFSATISLRDIRETGAPAISYQLHTIMIPEGVLTVDDQLVSISIGTLTEEIVALAQFAPTGFRHEITNYYGGGFWKNLWSGIKKVFKVGAPIARQLAGAVGSIASMIPHPVAQGIGKGANIANTVLGALGAGKGRGRPRKNGGAHMRTSSLSHRL